MTQVLFSIFFSKKIRTLTPLSRLHLTGPIHRVGGGGGAGGGEGMTDYGGKMAQYEH